MLANGQADDVLVPFETSDGSEPPRSNRAAPAVGLFPPSCTTHPRA